MILNNKRYMFSGFCLFHFCVSLFICVFALISFYSPSILLAILGVVVYLVFSFVIYRQNASFFVLFLFLFFFQFTAILSNLYIESGGLILEQFVHGYPTGSTMRLVAYNYIFFAFALLIFEKIKPTSKLGGHFQKTNSQRIGILVVYTIAIGMFVFLFAGLFGFGSPLLLGIDRFSYWQNHPLPLLDSVRYKMNILALLLGMITVQLKRSNKTNSLPKLLLLIIFLLNILYGDKFSGIVICSYLYFLPISLDSICCTGGLGVTRRSLLTGVLFGGVLLGVISYHYQNISVSKNVTDLIIARALGLQGHVWWGVDKYVCRANLDRGSGRLPNNASEILFGGGNKNIVSGLNALMYEVSPNSLVNAYIDRGIRFTMGNPAIGLYTLGYYGLLLYQLITAVLFVLFILYFRRQLLLNRLLRSSICTLILLGLYEAIIMGNVSFIITPYLLKYIFALFAIEALAIIYSNIFINNELIK